MSKTGGQQIRSKGGQTARTATLIEKYSCQSINIDQIIEKIRFAGGDITYLLNEHYPQLEEDYKLALEKKYFDKNTPKIVIDKIRDYFSKNPISPRDILANGDKIKAQSKVTLREILSILEGNVSNDLKKELFYEVEWHLSRLKIVIPSFEDKDKKMSLFKKTDKTIEEILLTIYGELSFDFMLSEYVKSKKLTGHKLVYNGKTFISYKHQNGANYSEDKPYKGFIYNGFYYI